MLMTGHPCKHLMSLSGLLHAAEAGTYAARHLVLRETSHSTPAFLAKRATLTIIGFGPQVEIMSNCSFSSTRVIGYETHLAGDILGSDALHLSYLGKLIQLQQVGSLAAPSRKVTSAPNSLMSFPK